MFDNFCAHFASMLVGQSDILILCCVIWVSLEATRMMQGCRSRLKRIVAIAISNSSLHALHVMAVLRQVDY